MQAIDMTYAGLALAALLLLWRLRAALRRSRERKERAFQRKLETVLLPKETVKALSPQKKGQYILTSKRVLAETKAGFTALDLKDIKSAHGTNAAGNRTTVPGKMVSYTIRAAQDLTLQNTGPEFEALVQELSAMLKKRREKKKK